MRTPVPPYCRLTVLAPGRRVDVALPADVPLAELVPLVLELLDEPGGPPARPDPWRFTGATGGPLSPASTLDELGVLDGEMVRFGPAVAPPPPPVFDDPVDALAALTGGTGPDHRYPAAVVAAVVVAAAALLATVPVEGAAVPGAGAAALGALGAVLALLRAARVTRWRPDDHPDDDPDDDAPPPGAEPRHDRTAVAAACCAVPLAAAAGWAALPLPAGPAHLLLAVVAAGTAAGLGQVAVRAAAPPLVAAVVAAAVTGTAIVVRVRFGVAVPALAAAAGAVALLAGPLLPRVVVRLAGLPRPVVPADAAGLVAADEGPDLLPAAELAERARLARGQLAGLSGGCAATAAVAAVLAAPTEGWAGPALGCVVAAVLLLRARSFADPGTARVHLTAGSAAATGLVWLVATVAGPPGRLVGALALLGAAAVATGVLGRTPPVASPVVRRALDLGEGLLTAAAVPLALAAAGVLAMARGL